MTVAIVLDHNNNTIHQTDDRHHLRTTITTYLRPHLLLRGTVRAVMRLGVQLCSVIASSYRVQKLHFQVCIYISKDFLVLPDAV